MALLLPLIAGCGPSEEAGTAGSALPVSPREAFQDDSGRTAAVLADGTLYLGAVSPADPSASVADQTRSAMQRLGSALAAAGLDYAQLASCHVHLSDMQDYDAMNEAYGGYFSTGGYPARTTLEFPGLPGGADVSLTCIAYAEASEIEVIRPAADKLPAPAGPYSPAVRAGRTVYLSGQGGRNPATGELAASEDEQARQALRNIGAILEAADLSYGNTVLASSYLPQGTDPAVADRAFESVFSVGGAPSRANVVLSALPGGIAIEITSVAVDDNYVTRLFMHDQAPTARSSPISQSGNAAFTSSIPGYGSSFGEQFHHALDASASALRLGSLALANVVRVNAYLRDLADLDELRALVDESFPAPAPAVSAAQAHLAGASMVSLEMIAVR